MYMSMRFTCNIGSMSWMVGGAISNWRSIEKHLCIYLILTY